jgi:hypothetical protein
MLNKNQIRNYLQWTAEDLLNQINKEKKGKLNLDEEKIDLIKQGIAFGLFHFNSKYSRVTKTYKKLSIDDFYKLLDLEQGKE